MPPLPPPAARQIGSRGLFRRMPPAVFPSLLGLVGVGLGWRRAAETTALPNGIAEMILGGVFLFWLFVTGAYISKALRRPSVLAEEVRLLPGRLGLAAANLAAFLIAAVLAPYAPALALTVLIVAVLSHLALGFNTLKNFLTGPEEARVVTPAWQLIFTGYILLPFSLTPLGYTAIANLDYYYAIFAACLIWGVSLVQLIRRIPPEPLRPLLAIHLAPASLITVSSTLLGHTTLAIVFLSIACAIFVALMASARWLTVSGFSPFWGAFTFPLAAFANALLAMGLMVPGLLVLVAATAVTVTIAVKVYQMWARGTLAIKTNTPTA